MRARRPLLLAAAALAAGTASMAGACSSGGDAPPITTVPPRPGGASRLGTTVPGTASPGTASPGTPATPGAATIDHFDVPASVTCRPGGTAEVRADYATDGARVHVTVDNRSVDGDPPTSGTFAIPLPCDGAVHTIVLSTYDANGRATLQSRAVLADDTAG